MGDPFVRNVRVTKAQSSEAGIILEKGQAFIGNFGDAELERLQLRERSKVFQSLIANLSRLKVQFVKIWKDAKNNELGIRDFCPGQSNSSKVRQVSKRF